jgi:hypothetical protein
MAEHNAEALRRLAILVSLSISVLYKRPLGDLKADLDMAGYPVGSIRLAADAVWLAEAGLATFDKANKVLILTAFGADVARGYLDFPGVARQGPQA